MDNKTGGKICHKIMTFSLITVLAGTGISTANINCKRNNPNEDICLKTKIEQMVLGPENALKHQANDLKRNGASNIEYHDSGIIETLPDNYIYQNGKGVKYIAINDNKLPNDYMETKLNTGETVGAKYIDTTKIELNNYITYNIEKDGITTKETWTYNEDNNDFEKYTLTTEVKNQDIITFCNKDNITPSNYIYVQGTTTESQPIRYSETYDFENRNIEKNFEQDNTNYEIDRIITFYNSKTDENVLANSYAGKLKDGERLILISKDSNTTVFALYKPKTNTKRVK